MIFQYQLKEMLLVLLRYLTQQVQFQQSKDKILLKFNYSHDNSYFFVHGKQIYKLKVDSSNVNFQTQFCLGSISNKFDNDESEEASLKENAYDFSVNYDVIDKPDN